MLKIVLSTHSEQYEKGEVMRDALQSLLGTGVFNSDGPCLLTWCSVSTDLYCVQGTRGGKSFNCSIVSL